jgi:hypothetical protein
MGGGAILFFTAPPEADKAKTSTRLRLAPAVSRSAGGFAVGGTW